MRKIKVITSLLLIFAMLFTMMGSSLAANDVVSKTEASSGLQLSEKQISTASKYITLKNNVFVIDKKIKNALTASEVALIAQNVATANKNAAEIINIAKTDSSVSLNVTSQNLKITGYSTGTTASAGQITPQAINRAAMWDYELNWWGPRIFLHNNFVTNISAWKDYYISLYGAGVYGITQLLIRAGMSGGVAGWIGVALVLAGAYTINRIENANNHCHGGVFIDGSWISATAPWSAFLVSKIYCPHGYNF